MAIRLKLADLRIERRLTQSQLAARLGVALGTVQNLETKCKSLNLELLDAICDTLNCDPCDLFERYEDTNSPSSAEASRQLKSDLMREYWVAVKEGKRRRGGRGKG